MAGISREEAAELVKNLTYFIDGIPMQLAYGREWVDGCDEYHLDQEYRIKPEPEVIWVNKYENEDITTHHSRGRAELYAQLQHSQEFKYIAKKFIAAE